jgi:tetratricopeptide (TPR) repeat protein
LFRLGLYQEVIEVCDKAIALDLNRDNLYVVHTNRGVALNKLKRYKEAVEAAEIALKLNPKHELAIFVKKHALSCIN